MPPAIPFIAAGAISGLGAVAAGTTILGLSVLASALIIGVGTAALGFLQSALQKTPDFSSRASSRTQMLRQPITERRWPGGELVLGGILTFYEATGNNQFHHMVVTLGDAPSAPWDGIDIVWLDNDPIFNSEIDGSGNVTAGKFAGKVRIKKHLGGPSQTADADLISEIARLDSNFKGAGIAYLYVRVDWDQTLFPNGLPQIRAWCRTNTVLDTRDATRRWTPNAALVLREYLTDSEIGLRYDASDFDATQDDAAANNCDEIVAAKAVGHAVVAVDAGNNELDLAVDGSGAPLRIETGDRMEIFTDGTAPGGLSAGTSYYAIVTRLVGANFEDADSTTISLSAGSYSGAAATAITNGNVDATHGTGIHAAVSLASSYANALARAAVSITSAGSGQHLVIKTGEPRYAAAGVVETGQTPKEVIEEILSAMAGRLVWTSGVFRILPAAWRTPITPTYDESDLMGPLTVRTKHSRRERFNAVRGILASQISAGEPTDYPPVIDSTYVANDNGIEIFRDIERPWTSRPAMAQRLGKIDLARHRREIRLEYPTGLQGFRAMPGSIVQISNARRGWTDKTFEVQEQEDLEIKAEGGGDLPVLGVTLRLAELDSTAFDFDPDTEETVKAPHAAPPGGSPFTAIAPSNIILTSGDSELFVKGDGTVVSRIRVQWTTEDKFVDHNEVHFKKSAMSTWESAGQVKAGTDELHIWDVEDGVSYDVRVRTINQLGVVSAWTQAAPHQAEGKSAPPPDVSTFNVARMADGTRRFSWTANVPADVRAGGGFKIKYISGTGGVWANMTELHTGVLDASPFETNELAAGTYTFGIKMEDSSANESVNAVLIEATLGDPRLREVLVARNEFQLGWPGVKVDAFVSADGFLEAEGLETWDDLPATWDALADTWKEIVASKTPITYTTPEIDLGTDLDFSPIVSAEPNANATLTMQTGSTADGAAVGSFVAIGPVNGVRYIKIRAEVSGTAPFLNDLVTLLDGETQIEDYEDIDTSGASAGPFERIATGHFKLATRGNTANITSATIRAFQNAGSGWTTDLLSKSTTITGNSEPAAEFQIFKDGVLTDATIDAEIRGPKK